MRCQRRVSVGLKAARNLLTDLHALNFEQQPATPWNQLTRRCRTLGFHAVDRGGRGDCFYRSLQHQLAEAGMGDYKVAHLRSILATWLRANENFNVNVEDPAGGVTDPLRNFLVRDQYRLPVKQGDAPLLDPAFDGHDWEHFCSRVEDPVAKLWASHLVVIAASRHFQVQIQVTSTEAVLDKFFYYPNARTTLHLGFLPEFHYVSCVREIHDVEADNVAPETSSVMDLDSDNSTHARSGVPPNPTATTTKKCRSLSSFGDFMPTNASAASNNGRRRVRKFANSDSDDDQHAASAIVLMSSGIDKAQKVTKRTDNINYWSRLSIDDEEAQMSDDSDEDTHCHEEDHSSDMRRKCVSADPREQSRLESKLLSPEGQLAFDKAVAEDQRQIGQAQNDVQSDAECVIDAAEEPVPRGTLASAGMTNDSTGGTIDLCMEPTTSSDPDFRDHRSMVKRKSVKGSKRRGRSTPASNKASPNKKDRKKICTPPGPKSSFANAPAPDTDTKGEVNDLPAVDVTVQYSHEQCTWCGHAVRGLTGSCCEDSHEHWERIFGHFTQAARYMTQHSAADIKKHVQEQALPQLCSERWTRS